MQRELEDHYKNDLFASEQILRDGFLMVYESDKQKVKNLMRKKLKSLDKIVNAFDIDGPMKNIDTRV